MGRLGLTEEDIKFAIKKLQEDKKDPTIINIRKMLGKGSMSTIARHRNKLIPSLKRISCNEHKLIDIIECVVSALKKIDSRMNEIFHKIR